MKIWSLTLFLLFFTSRLLIAQPTHASYKQYFKYSECNEVAFNYAWQGYQILLQDSLLKNQRYLTIIDFTKPSNQQRFFILDVAKQQLVLASITAHGVGSDLDSTTIPYCFGNTDGCRMSSIGFYITGNFYSNHRPSDSLGLCLFGMDNGYNDSAAKREIVIHYGATEYTGRVYVTDSGAARSYGCPALPLSTNTKAIKMISGGSCLFIYSNKVKNYARNSTVLNNKLSARIVQQGPPPNNCSCDLRKRK